MRVYLSSPHRYPGWRFGVASSCIHDRLARGLAELGHEVRYHLINGSETKLPDGVALVESLRGGEDVLHINHTPIKAAPVSKLPWVKSVHSDLIDIGVPRDTALSNFIFVSQTMAHLHRSQRFVRNGLDPEEFIYSETKNPYFLFVISGSINKALRKGLDTALWLANQTATKLVVAGGSGYQPEMAQYADLCRAHGSQFIGIVNGQRKAEVFAAARALLFPTKMSEAFGLPVAEAMMSGTPVIASDRGAMSELVDPAAGFVCASESDYLDAVQNLGRIKPADCRRLALERFHYLDMARGYLREYEREIGSTETSRTHVAAGN